MTREMIVRNPGLLSLIQDAGRTGFQRYGVSVSGAADQEALLIGNLLVGNEPDDAAIEVTFGGAEFEFSQDAYVAITGGDLQPSLDGTPLSMWESFFVPAGSMLHLVAPMSGMRSYIAIDGGIDTPLVLGSRSTHYSSGLGGISGSALKPGDIVPLGINTDNATPGAKFPSELRTEYGSDLTVRVIAGPQQEQFSPTGIQSFYASAYTVTESSDRQGLRLDGPQIESSQGKYDIVSDAVVPGSIQVPGDGKPIVLMTDSQTTGGYAKIGVVASVDLPLLAQAPPGTVIHFAEVSVPEAQSLMRERRRAITEADMLTPLRKTRQPLTVDGVDKDVSVTYRSDDSSQPGGTLASVEINGIRSTVRIEEIN